MLRVAGTRNPGGTGRSTSEQDGPANAPLWQQLRQQDEQAVRQLLGQLHQMMHQPGFQNIIGAGGGS